MSDTRTVTSVAPETAVSPDAIDQIFREARTHNVWLPRAVPIELLQQAYELAALGPTSANSSPGRFVFLTTPRAKERLRPALSAGNLEKTMAAPVTAIIAWDTEFHEKLPKLFPHKDMRAVFAGKSDLIHETAFRNGSLEGAYFILAARAGPRLRPHVGVQCPQSRCRVLSRRQMEIEFSLQHRLRRFSRESAAVIR